MAGADVFGGHVEVVHANHADDGGFLDDGDDFVAEGGDDVFDGLGSDNFAENGEVREAKSETSFGLALVDGEDATTDDF